VVRGRENPQVEGKGQEKKGKQKTGGRRKSGDPHGRTRGFAGYESISEEIRLVVRLGNGESEYGVDQREGDLAVLLGDAAPDALLGIHFRHQDGCSVDERVDWAFYRYGEALHASEHGPYCDCQAALCVGSYFFCDRCPHLSPSTRATAPSSAPLPCLLLPLLIFLLTPINRVGSSTGSGALF
jgi:hypothetical protein